MATINDLYGGLARLGIMTPQQRSNALLPEWNPANAMPQDANQWGSGFMPGNSIWDNQNLWGGTSFDPKTGAFTQKMGAVPTALNTFGGLANLYMGMKMFGLAKKDFRENRRQFNLNYNAQARTLNSTMENRQKALYSASPQIHSSPAEFMAKYGIKGI